MYIVINYVDFLTEPNKENLKSKTVIFKYNMHITQLKSS